MTRRKFFNCFAFIAILAAVIFSMVFMYQEENHFTANIISITEQQYINESNTTYTYLVSTDKGVMEIEPDGIFSSKCFGTLKEGCTYELHTRGFSIPIIGVYPFIVDSKEIK